MRDMINNKRGLIWSEIAWWVIGLVILALVTVFLLLISKQGQALIEKIREFLMFGR